MSRPDAQTEPGFHLRTTPAPSDPGAIERIVTATGFFRDDEVAVAVELADEALRRGRSSGYLFVFAEDADGHVAGYACYGPIACTVGSFDLYWIAVDPTAQGRGLGRALMREVEVRVGVAGGRRIYIETSSQPQYEPTRRFYASCGYRLEATLAGFYQPGDDKLIYGRDITGR